MLLAGMMPARLDAVSPKLRNGANPEPSPKLLRHGPTLEPAGPPGPGLSPLDVEGLPSGVVHRGRGLLQGSPPVSGFAPAVTPTMIREGSGMYSNADNDEKKKRFTLKSVWDFLFLVMQTSSIHGFNHLTDEKRHFCERIVWTAFVLFGLCGAVVVSMSTWNHYQENPTVISMERDYKEWNTSFPSVTICPTVKYEEKNVEAVAESMTKIEDKERLKLFLMKLANATYDTFGDVPDDFNDVIRPSEYMDLVLAVKLEFYYTVSGSNTEANNIGQLQTTITEHGLCYAFNSDIAIYNSPEYFKAKNLTIMDRGWSFFGSPLDGDVFAQVMDMNSGYLVYLHSSNETADFASQRLESPAGSYKTLDISALSIYTSGSAANLKVEQRRCRFLKETNLILSPVYSYNLCRNECRMKLAQERCGCVPHFYRPVHPFKICDVKGMHCLAKYQDLMSTLRDPVTKKKVNCKCLPPCDDVNYIIENDHTMPWFLGTNLKWGMTKYPRMRLKRDVIFGFIDVLVSVGGTAGLFLGCSVLSLIEIFYFFTLKAFFYVLEHYRGKPDEEDEERAESADSEEAMVPRPGMPFAPRSFSNVYLRKMTKRGWTSVPLLGAHCRRFTATVRQLCARPPPPAPCRPAPPACAAPRRAWPPASRSTCRRAPCTACATSQTPGATGRRGRSSRSVSVALVRRCGDPWRCERDRATGCSACRVFWMSVCVAAFISTYYLLIASYTAFRDHAVSFVSETAYLDWNTTFPAVSVCETESPDKLYESATKVFGTDRNRNLDFFLRDIVFFDGTCRSCSTQCSSRPDDGGMKCRDDFMTIIDLVRSTCPGLLIKCRWNGQPFDCCKNFLPLQTETGLCYTINSLHNRYKPNGTPVNKDLVELISNRMTGPGTLEFMAKESIKIFIHAPEDVPNFNHPQDEKESLFWGLNFHMRFSVTEIENDPQLTDVSVEQRNCRFPHENPLNLHNKYSYSTCIVECHARFQMQFCNCTHHYMPNMRNMKVQTCGVEGLACLNSHSEELRSLKTSWSSKPGLACDCVSSCTEPEYSVVWKSSQGNDVEGEGEHEQGTRVRLMLDSLPTTRFRRNVVRTRLDLVVSMGGTAGLFLGASLLTFVELVYYACRTPSYKLMKEREAQQRKRALQEARQAKSVEAVEGRGWSRLREDHRATARATATVRQVQPAMQPTLAGLVSANLPRKAYAFPTRRPVQDPFDLYM
ncbi:uncharacterized protein LOC117653133 [Thrips palmi]|uniref:Uncharacterized protein LOC117653133 n=1 Tax=Thrips palmi TaxID=161013 RepID=A0A6P9AFP6_THRPL|nr:uncharacterized protein LOC117653133 [Thrips palmi]